MTATSHAIIGAVIAAKIGNPAIAIPVAILSHIAADAFPHWDTGTNRLKKNRSRFFLETLIDVALGLIISFILLRFLFPSTDLIYAFVIILASQALDWSTAPFNFFNTQSPPFSTLYYFQKTFDNRLDKPWGIIGQVAILIFIIVLVKSFL